VIALFNTVFFLGVLLFVLVALSWQLIWTLRRGRLPALAWLPGVTRRDMPVPFWGYVAGLTLMTLLAATFAVILLSSALRFSA
jgi:hypothetical protein